MRRNELFVLSTLLLTALTACTTFPESGEHSLTNVAQTPYKTSIATPVEEGNLRRVTPSSTPSSTPTLTPYPTFDSSKVVTSTPFALVTCPQSDSDFVLPELSQEEIFDYAFRMDELILQLLSNGASFAQIQQLDNSYNLGRFTELDLTGDSIPELVIGSGRTYVIGCMQNRYELLLVAECNCAGLGASMSVSSVQDMNLNGVPEVVFEERASAGLVTIVYIYEWDGGQFVPLLVFDVGSEKSSQLARTLYWYERYFDSGMNSGAEVWVQDLDQNGTRELVLKDHGQSHIRRLRDNGPWRAKQVIYAWDGLHFIYSNLEMDPPDYRFQAVQDADRFFLMGNYDDALAYYRQAINNENLEWWSRERMRYISYNIFTPPPVTPPPTPRENVDEYVQLSAYAHFRILLALLHLGYDEEAHVAYTYILDHIPPDSVGYPYAEMATFLWDSYQDSGDLAVACAPVVEYAEAHPELLLPLGGQEHGGQSHIYEPFDVCPFTWLASLPNQ